MPHRSNEIEGIEIAQLDLNVQHQTQTKRLASASLARPNARSILFVLTNILLHDGPSTTQDACKWRVATALGKTL